MLGKMTLAVVLSTTLMTSSIPLPASFQKAKGLVVENDESNIINFKTPQERFKELEKEVAKKTEENNKKKLEEQKRIEKQKLLQKQEEDSHKKTFILTYYGQTDSECGNSKGITSSGKRVEYGMVAVPRDIPFGSKIIIDGNTFIAEDTGNPKYICELPDGSIRIDVFIPKEYGESISQYEKRISNMGTKKVNGELYIRRR